MIDMKYKLFVFKKVGVLPDISYKPVFEREIVLGYEDHISLETIFDTFRVLYPNKDEYKITIEF